MKHADFRDVPDELWERIKPLLPSSNKKEEAAADSFHSVLFLSESATNAGTEANRLCFPRTVVEKVLSMSTFNSRRGKKHRNIKIPNLPQSGKRTFTLLKFFGSLCTQLRCSLWQFSSFHYSLTYLFQQPAAVAIKSSPLLCGCHFLPPIHPVLETIPIPVRRTAFGR